MTYSDVDARGQAETRGDGAAPAREPYGLDDLTGLTMTAGAISPAMARHMRDTMHFERQRPISDRNVTRLAEEMRRGWFLAGTPIFICTLPDGREYIVNGNHTLEAVHTSGVTVPLVLIRKRVRDMENAARCYSTFDMQAVRNWKATLLATGFSESLPIPDKVASAVGVIMAGFKYAPNDQFMNKSRHARLEILPDYVKAAHLIKAAMDQSPRPNQRIIERAAILGVALYTARYQPSMAEEFWGGMAKDDGLKANDPRKSLLRFASNHRVTGSSDREMHAKAAALAWNAYFKGQTLDVCKPAQMLTIRIHGTPMHKGAA
jgi:hypothetical protein